MKANNLIIDGIDYIGTFYHQIKGNANQKMYIQHDDDDTRDSLVEFGYTKIGVMNGYYNEVIQYMKTTCDCSHSSCEEGKGVAENLKKFRHNLIQYI